MARFFGFNAPFLSNRTRSGLLGPTYILPRQVDERLIKNDLLQLLLTSPGERVMRPDFGAPIRSFLFEPIVDESIAELERQIKSVVVKYEKRVNLVEVRIVQDESILKISLLGTFNLDKFRSNAGDVSAPDLLVELNIPVKKAS